jgi:hypothetical protein
MSRIIIAALVAISTAAAEAADGCGRGWFYNGRRCVPQDEPGPRYYGPRPRYYEPEPPVAGPQLRLDLGRRDEPQYPPPNPGFKTWNHCPQNYTVQDGQCKPYRGR